MSACSPVGMMTIVLFSLFCSLTDGKGKFRLKRQSSHPKGFKDKVKIRQLQKQLSAGNGTSEGAAFLDDLNLLASSTKSGRNAKQKPGLEYGFLVQV